MTGWMGAWKVKKMDVFTNGEWPDRRKDRWPDIWIYDWMYYPCTTLLYAALFSLVITVYNIAKHTNRA